MCALKSMQQSKRKIFLEKKTALKNKKKKIKYFKVRKHL